MENLEKYTNEELCVMYQETLDEKIYDYLLETNIGFIISRLRKYLKNNIDSQDDIMQFARVALWDCVKRFDIDRGYKLTTYLAYYVKRASSYWERTRHTIRIPAYILANKEKYKEKLYSTTCQSLNTILNVDDDNYDHELLEILSDSESEITDEKIDELTDHTALRSLLSNLGPKYQDVMEWYLGLKDGKSHTMEEIGQNYGVTRERIRQILVEAIRKLSKYVGNYLDISAYCKNSNMLIDSKRKIYMRNKKRK